MLRAGAYGAHEFADVGRFPQTGRARPNPSQPRFGHRPRHVAERGLWRHKIGDRNGAWSNPDVEPAKPNAGFIEHANADVPRSAAHSEYAVPPNQRVPNDGHAVRDHAIRASVIGHLAPRYLNTHLRSTQRSDANPNVFEFSRAPYRHRRQLRPQRRRRPVADRDAAGGQLGPRLESG